MSVPIRIREKTHKKRFKIFAAIGSPVSFLRQSTEVKNTIKRLIAQTAHISKKPRLAYSATVKSSGRSPLKALKKYASCEKR